ncbi:bifunctional glutamate N-acetyltransferase/amino-acid acetyltransferase ArgJ [Defluviicoccus vanus]|uniref:Arginine biosynthesis bifunctional protein ArgJ n=1 Tax=Defluviicoccus vanus TaxID=111831 RepID=A0A7H1MY45_9PROT|nr:bifunctional glutamate N-acetyltransferase/amino-acid acetyltransferase ArgJ [Defluviicoccus vanus]QNT68381.1 bifunctional glutamate N-acetyltransferase/amino-acid acetyltransferase ArgJ [Defluviicoccus vanus]
MTKVSPFAPAHFPDLPVVGGVRLAVAAAGIRYRDRNDLLLAEFDRGTSVAGVFTRSQTAAAPVQWCRDAIGQGQARALVVNAGNANAFTGTDGPVVVETTVSATTHLFNCRPSQVLVASTGVIGEPLPVDRLTAALPDLHLRLGEADWQAAARTIATTDTFAKGAGCRVEIEGTPVAIAGIAKGSGMIAPDMATMLAFIFTDASITAPALQTILAAATARSFNCITVDGDTSTNDTVLMFATGSAGPRSFDDPADPKLAAFRAGVDAVCLDLAQQVVRDGEGVSKFVSITITGAQDADSARHIGLTVANSPLVKTAIAGSDANWGRIVAAVGRAGEWIDRDRLAIRIGGVLITEDGGPLPDYDETPVAEHMRGREIAIEIDVGVSDGSATVWTGDLTHGYIDINADYRS